MRNREQAAERWRGLIAEQAASGKNAAAFCRGRGIWPSCFFRWKRKLSDVPLPAAFVEVQAAEPAPAAVIELELGRGLRVPLRAGFDAELLRQVVRALEPPR